MIPSIALSAEEVIEHLQRNTEDAELVRCFWVCAAGDRERFASELHSMCPGEPVVAMVVRQAAFDDPNALLQDLATVIQQNREMIVSRSNSVGELHKLDLILVARKTLDVPPTASPIHLPEWFPICASETVMVRIADLTWRADTSLSSGHLRVSELLTLLFELDGLLLRRLVAVREYDHNRGNALFERLRSDDADKMRIGPLLEAAATAREGVRNPEAFRPSTGRPVAIVSWLWRMANRTSSDQMSAAGAALATAVGLTAAECVGAYEPLIAVLGRPSTPDGVVEARYCRNLLLLIRSVCQLSTAAAHADDYSAYPVNLLRAYAVDLQRGLLNALRVLERVQAPDAS